MLEPVFVKADIHLTLEGRNLEFRGQNISVFGVTGLAWSSLSAQADFGKVARIVLRVTGGELPLELQGSARIMREYTAVGEHMGLRFDFTPDQARQLADRIAVSGFYPTDHLRKYPRIPSAARIPTFPLRAMCRSETGWSGIFDIGNLSPNGLLVYTENQAATELAPGQRLELTLEPRGWFPVPIKVEGLICRVVDDINRVSGNLIRYFGVKFTRVDEVNRMAFLDLLKDILQGIRKT
jgi:hypothetical protein